MTNQERKRLSVRIEDARKYRARLFPLYFIFFTTKLIKANVIFSVDTMAEKR